MKISSLWNHHHTHFNQLYRKVFVSVNNNNNLSNHFQNHSTSSSSTSNITPSQDYYFAHNRFEALDHPKPSIQSVVFDMDGTLTVPCIDFKKMRLETGIPLPQDLLTTIHALSDEKEKKRLFDIIDRIEEEANEKLAFQPHLFELLDELVKLKMVKSNLLPNDANLVVETASTTLGHYESTTNAPISRHFAVVTRNSEKSLKFFVEKLGSKYSDFFTILLSREFLPYKPNPGCLLHIAQQLNLQSPANILMVGDSFHDILCAKNAGAYSCLYTSETHWTETHTNCVEEYQPDFICHDLRHLVHILNYMSSL
ncbi:hypothetical protein C9374_011086 [Naegleria lovaniensis]|uniref:Uncharacterized protein n=1 Tax=Naegleria lovaniensis TaxID=51637 RepID=A0AA88GGN4_NAELO|nr:uncharacterized protein C9374_011033 [Naegleria lovaniensis]XP_044543423.1 uncharacterized protein C9374_011086 [Naegleria lovaniensis]KAG2374196.1 hypothetical protein C9374_011033 [Naegleria lovaniensis]KAG2374249.1 hypothetical protein C9374_011086 [Naegleria lovaniensis]